MSPSIQRSGPGLLQEHPTIAVLRAQHASEYLPVIGALVAGGVTSIELTLSTEGVLDALPDLVSEFRNAAVVGVGTITSVDQAIEALDKGAAYLVTPTLQPDVIAAAVDRGIPVLPGGLTPTELHAAWTAGATAVKVFPASTVGAGYIGAMRGPFPDMQFVPSGGVDIDDAPVWIRAGAIAVSLGSPLVQDAFRGGDLQDLRARATRVSTLVRFAAEQKA